MSDPWNWQEYRRLIRAYAEQDEPPAVAPPALDRLMRQLGITGPQAHEDLNLARRQHEHDMSTRHLEDVLDAEPAASQTRQRLAADLELHRRGQPRSFNPDQTARMGNTPLKPHTDHGTPR